MLDNSGLSEKMSQEVSQLGTIDRSPLPLDDIPEALRDLPEMPAAPTRQPQNQWLFWLGFGAIAIAISLWLRGQLTTAQTGPESAETMATQISPSPSPLASSGKNKPKVNQDNILGHFSYSEAPVAELQSITSDGAIKLRKAAAQKYLEMVEAAANAGIVLVPLSGFRTIQEQQYLFFEVKAERGQETRKRAAVSAPPGYSEHHTGYAIDLGDGHAPETHLNPNFENTAAFRWLQVNAPRYSFELSFTKNNPQGISYEPWHWRFVGNQHSLETFYKAKSLKK